MSAVTIVAHKPPGRKSLANFYRLPLLLYVWWWLLLLLACRVALCMYKSPAAAIDRQAHNYSPHSRIPRDNSFVYTPPLPDTPDQQHSPFQKIVPSHSPVSI